MIVRERREKKECAKRSENTDESESIVRALIHRRRRIYDEDEDHDSANCKTDQNIEKKRE